MDENNKKYELSFLLKNPEAAGEIDNELKAAGGNILEKGPIKEINLAYPIKKYNSANFGFYYFQSNPQAVQELSHRLNLKQSVLRFLIITPPIQKKQPSYRPLSQSSHVPPQVAMPQVLSNEALEEKLEEILK